ncbi:cation:proton antiporter [Actinomycetospora soli]|uniref:cation:proton antiporter n=1 Tax=Actinomycetospora soli TaxID=2893887 RepID=UPI001E441E89|nr:monovalent cation/H(+) antiporter subunit G [Actinomycetospora soli]MCD2190876.1 monovalent cation/H(+) antiporter subunit G [Actinomycetospora soli]
MSAGLPGILGQVLVAFGAAIFVVAALGLLRLPDVYARASAVTLAAEAGTVAILLGALLLMPSVGNGLKVVLAVALQVVGCAVGGMMVVRSGYLTGARLAAGTARDDLARDAGAGRLPRRGDG